MVLESNTWTGTFQSMESNLLESFLLWPQITRTWPIGSIQFSSYNAFPSARAVASMGPIPSPPPISNTARTFSSFPSSLLSSNYRCWTGSGLMAVNIIRWHTGIGIHKITISFNMEKSQSVHIGERCFKAHSASSFKEAWKSYPKTLLDRQCPESKCRLTGICHVWAYKDQKFIKREIATRKRKGRSTGIFQVQTYKDQKFRHQTYISTEYNLHQTRWKF